MKQRMQQTKAWKHPKALVESSSVGAGTRVWAFAHIMKDAIVGSGCNIGEQVFVESGARIGDRVTVKNGVQVWEGVTLEDDVFVGPGVAFTNDRYPRSPRSAAAGEKYSTKAWIAPVVVERGASIGANATVVCGVTIGRSSMIAAGAVVTKSIPAFALVRGVPARICGYVCVCGQPLAIPKNGRVACRECRRCYHRIPGGLVAG